MSNPVLCLARYCAVHYHSGARAPAKPHGEVALGTHKLFSSHLAAPVQQQVRLLPEFEQDFEKAGQLPAPVSVVGERSSASVTQPAARRRRAFKNLLRVFDRMWMSSDRLVDSSTPAGSGFGGIVRCPMSALAALRNEPQFVTSFRRAHLSRSLVHDKEPILRGCTSRR
ncbi:hypothetical protein N658DRAFT_496110 [Parathielavia hyrcaniae]|uniref:Uncharacterized protein n=1 Tax=Parathielavia hyrcaniae TaxID=113614 RepID=A0AAN6T1I6_9PEZI|nr:hypothetical protein N658DRAFT_496110 [Parathielavia hyrcaniae]